ncbi:hypothetical protein CH364_06650 [Leptospira harrisiae]|uniref:Uncharacterized protein n=1 Tax=Leptospira harrisiae TaxID=2023189 RepID=A0A2N0ANH2_9LEPT|nr:hypothetical protein CH364_06650 [Leptospira harrisiae]
MIPLELSWLFFTRSIFPLILKNMIIDHIFEIIDHKLESVKTKLSSLGKKEVQIIIRKFSFSYES